MFSYDHTPNVYYYNIYYSDFQAPAIAHVKSNHEGQENSRKNLTMEKSAYFRKRRYLEGRDGIYHGGEKQNQGGICKVVQKGKEI